MKKFFSFVLLTVLLVSCKKESADTARLEGSWDMTGYLAFTPTAPVLQVNDVTWNLNLTTNKLTVINYVSTTYPYLLASGVYDIVVSGSFITINNTVYTYEVNGDYLKIENNPQVDGPGMYFKRN